MTLSEWAVALQEAMASALSEDDFDVVLSDDGKELELMTDEWTLHVEQGASMTAWLALDLEPETVEEARAMRRKAMSAAVDQALAQTDRRLDGALMAALASAADPLTLDLLGALKAR